MEFDKNIEKVCEYKKSFVNTFDSYTKTMRKNNFESFFLQFCEFFGTGESAGIMMLNVHLAPIAATFEPPKPQRIHEECEEGTQANLPTLNRTVGAS